MDVAHPSGCSSTALVDPPAWLGSSSDSDEVVRGRVHESSVVDDRCFCVPYRRRYANGQMKRVLRAYALEEQCQPESVEEREWLLVES